MNLTESQMIAELERLLVIPANDDGHQTAGEIEESTGWSLKKVHRALKSARRAGRLSRIHVWRSSIDGRQVPVAGYKITTEEPTNV